MVVKNDIVSEKSPLPTFLYQVSSFLDSFCVKIIFYTHWFTLFSVCCFIARIYFLLTLDSMFLLVTLLNLGGKYPIPMKLKFDAVLFFSGSNCTCVPGPSAKIVNFLLPSLVFMKLWGLKKNLDNLCTLRACNFDSFHSMRVKFCMP